LAYISSQYGISNKHEKHFGELLKVRERWIDPLPAIVERVPSRILISFILCRRTIRR